MSEWNLTVENIGVFKGKYNFTFRRGLNIINAPNAAGKTSLLKALKILSEIPEDQLFQYLNDFSESGRVTLENTERFAVSITRTKDGVKYLKREKLIGDGRARDVIFVMEGNPLVEYVEKGDVEKIIEWFRTFTDIDRIETIRDVVTNLFRDLRNQYLDRKRVADATLKEIEKTLDEVKKELKKIDKRIIEILTSKEFKQVKTILDQIQSKISNLEEEKTPLLHQFNNVKADITNIESNVKSEDEEIKMLQETLTRKLKEESEGKLRLETLRRDLEIFKDRLEFVWDIIEKTEKAKGNEKVWL